MVETRRGAVSMVSRNIDHLREHGPATVEELPNEEVSINDRMNGTDRFLPRTSSAGGANLGSHGCRAVYYLRGEHDPESVLRIWAAEHPHTMDSITLRSWERLAADHSKEWTSAARTVWSEVRE